MQDLLSELFWRSEEIDERAAQLCETLPGYQEAKERCWDTAEQIRDLVGPELYDRFYDQFLRYTGYEVRAYYSLGLGLRAEVVRAMGL